MTTSSTWKIPLGTSPRKSNDHSIIKELEQKLKGRQGGTDFKLSDMSKVSPVLTDERRNSKTLLSDKQTINENMLQARARWAAQTKPERDDTEEVSDKKFAMSLEATSRFCIDADDQLDTENVTVRSKRALSNSFPKSQRIIPAPPTGCPPVLENRPPSGGSNRSPQTQSGDYQVRVGQRGLQGEKQMKQVSGTGLKSAAIKKFKKLVKGKQSKSAGNMVKSIPTNKPRKKVGIKKALSENIIIQRQISNPSLPQGSTDDSSIPSGNIRARDYQNIIDDLEESRSNTNSPTDWSVQSRKPRPLPRRGYAGSIRHSLGSNDSDTETPPPTQSLSPLVTSPTNMATPTSAKSDSSNQSGLQVIGELELPKAAYFEASEIREELFASGEILEDGESTEEDEDLTSFIPQDVITKKPLGKATSFNPTARRDWDPFSRNSTIEQKKLRRAVFSDGDQDDACDDYIKMNSVCLKDYPPVDDPRGTKVVAASSDSCITLGESRSLQVAANPKNSLVSCGRSPILSIPTYQRRDSNGFSGLGVPTDEKRSSAHYLKIISGQPASTIQPSSQPQPVEASGRDTSGREQKKAEEEEVEFYGEVCHLHEPLARVPSNDGSSIRPSLNVVAMDFVPSSFPENSWNKQGTKSPTQYTSVTVDSSPKKRTPSAPKKFKYQTVVLRDESSGTTITETENPDSKEGDTVRRKLSESSKERRPLSPSVPVKKAHHPLLNLDVASVSALRQSERSYYINRKSLIEIECCKDLPTTMLSTVDVATGKVVWHEYVEIDEDQIDKMVNTFGVAKSVPIPEKLGMLLSMPKLKAPPNTTTEVETPVNQDASGREDRSQSLDSVREDDGSNSLNSSMSSECNYIFNLNDPPNIPPRPDNLDALVDQLKDRTSGDYSYAFFPQNHLFGRHWMKTTKAPLHTSISQTGLGVAQEAKKDKLMAERKTSAPLPVVAKATKKESKLSPPLLPPKTHSLLREQKLVIDQGAAPEPYLMPIIVRTKAEKKKAGKETGSPTFVSYIRDASNSRAPTNQHTRRTSPPKPLPYLEHKKKKQQQLFQYEASSPHNLLSTIASPHSSNAAVGMRYQDSVRRRREQADSWGATEAVHTRKATRNLQDRRHTGEATIHLHITVREDPELLT